jgi:hypothetical protein
VIFRSARLCRLPGTDGVYSEVGLNNLPPLSERMGPKDKNAKDFTDSKSLAAPAHNRESFNKSVRLPMITSW